MKKTKKSHSVVFKVLRAIIALIVAIVILLAGFIGFLSVTEFKPNDTETIEVGGNAKAVINLEDSFTVLSWNIGYGALGDNADFFMDGGTSVKTADTNRVHSNMQGIIKTVKEIDPDILFLQEVDVSSSRSNKVNEYALLQDEFEDFDSSFANNFKVAYLPYPMPPLGKIDSGIATFSSCDLTSAERVQLPIPFSWPIRMANLKRCLLISRVKIEGSDKELVLVNLHLEAYDSGEGKIAQTKMLAEILNKEADKGNYVIAGGDFNQIFSSTDTKAYPTYEGNWEAPIIDTNEIKGDWQFLMDSTYPSCRSLGQVYEGADKDAFQYYLIDGFIVSGNIKVESVETQDRGFVYTDHNPVVLQLKFN